MSRVIQGDLKYQDQRLQMLAEQTVLVKLSSQKQLESLMVNPIAT